MSFRLFIYYCALSGGGGAFLGWAIGRSLAGQGVLGDGIKGLWLGLGVALALGGILGAFLYLVLQGVWLNLLSGKPRDQLWSPSSWGFVALGACIGLLIGLTQVILKEAWIKVEQGFRKGRELILAKQEVTVG